jgi:hypothetical protein
MNRIKPAVDNPAKAQVDDLDLPAMKKGDKVKIKDRYYPGTQYTNPVKWIDGIIERGPFDVDGKPGYMVKVYFDKEILWHEFTNNIRRSIR